MDSSYTEFLRIQGHLPQLYSAPRFPFLLFIMLVLVCPISVLLRWLIYSSDAIKVRVKTLELVLGEKHMAISNAINLDSTKIFINVPRNFYDDDVDVYTDRYILLNGIFCADRILKRCVSLGPLVWKRYYYRIVKQVILECSVFRKYSCEVFVFYNDHTPYCVGAAKIFQSRGAKTVYVQHAPVGEHFPPLQWSLSLLYSMRYFDVYKSVNMSRNVPFDENRIRIIGDLRLRKLANFKKNINDNKTILIAYNLLDDLYQVERTAYALQDEGWCVKIRPHPLDNRKTRLIKETRSGLLDDLSVVDGVVCNESAILLEAAYCGLYVYKASFWSESLDNYGFLSSGFCKKEYDNLKSLTVAIEEKEMSYDKSLIEYFTGNVDNNININEMINEVFS